GGIVNVVYYDGAVFMCFLRQPLEIANSGFIAVVCIDESKIDLPDALEEGGKGTIYVARNKIDILLTDKLECQGSDIGYGRCTLKRGDMRFPVFGEVQRIDAKRCSQFDDRFRFEALHQPIII